ncbi:MAG: WG repeat-containing protein, partial [Synergistaceae bacterium]|nr:WG repeat-containing protein [Synergistaceae bacterium]
RWVIEPKFTRAGEFHEGLAAVYIRGRWGYIKTDGKYAIRPQYVEAGDFAYGVAPVRTRTTYRGWGYIGHWNNKAIPRR